ncbi:MAG: PAAR-like protein [Niabella sp.]
MSKKYIPDKCWLTCDKGQMPTQIKVTHNNNSKIYGEKLVSEADMVPGENVKPFGACAVKGSCCYMPVYWDKCNQNVKVNGFKLVFEDASLLCKYGGKIKVDFSIPTGPMFDFGFTGLGIASQWMNYKDVIDYNQRGVIYDVENGKISLTTESGWQGRKGNYGEMKDNVYYREQGWRDIRSEHPVMDIDKDTKPGIDGAYERGGTYKETDAKYNSATLKTNAGSGNRELDVDWTNEHIDNGAIANSNDERAMRRANNSGTLQRSVTNVGTDGSMKDIPVNSQGYRNGAGAKSDIQIKPPAKASQFISGMRSSLRNSKPVEALANSKFSTAIRESAAATKSNNALWKASQFMESTPALKTTGKVIGRGAIVVGIALDAISIASAYQEEGGFGDKTQKATGSAIGGAAGAWAGAEIGAVIGTAICPGVGTVIGGIVGGIIGGLAGSDAGSKLVDWLF